MRSSWWAHLCGLCLSLRDEHGQLARVATNYDGLIISALVEAQSVGGSPRRVAGPCPMRGMRTAAVSIGSGARLAASASLVLAAAKVRDHVSDGDGVFAQPTVAGAARVVANRWARQGSLSGAVVGFDTAGLTEAIQRQPELEQSAGPGEILLVTEPTETATAAACAHTAVLAGRPANVAPLTEVGRLFGRVVHLVDAVEDLDEDRESGVWNPLDATGTSLETARRLCDDAVLGVRLALSDVEFADGALVHALLVHELEQAVIRAFARRTSRDMYEGKGGGLWLPRFHLQGRRQGAIAGCGIALFQCCTCQYCCRDPFPGPWSGEPHSPLDCCDCGCPCDCCDCTCC